jgi:hypothetical protein
MGLVPLVQVSAGENPWPGGYDNGTLIYSMVILLLGLIAYDVGALVGSWYPSSSLNSVFHPRALSKKRVYLLSLLAIALTVISMFKMGTRFSLEQSLSASETTKTSTLIWSTLLRIPAFSALALNWWIWLNRDHILTRNYEARYHIVVLCCLALMNLVANNPFSLSRVLLGTMGLSLIFMTLTWKRRHSNGVLTVVLGLLLLIVFPQADIFRGGEARFDIQPVATQLLLTADYDAFQQLANTVLFVTDHGTTIGYQLLGALLFWVPRSLWLDKPLGSGHIVGEYMGYSQLNLSSPLWAEAYINAGLVGVIVAFLVYGFVTNLLQRSYSASQRKPSFIGVIIPILAAYQMYLLRGDLQNGIAYLTPLIAYSLLATTRMRVNSDGDHK